LKDTQPGGGTCGAHQLERHFGLEDQVVSPPDIANAAPSDARDHPVSTAEHIAR
jgi:hypothetical protein